MPTGRLNMRRIRDVLRLKFSQGLSERVIASSLGLGKGSVGTYLRRARDAELSWPLPDGLDDDGLELLLLPASPSVADPSRPVPDWSMVDKELRKRGVTRMLLWQEYREQHPGGFGYTWFCTHFDAWKGRVRLSMRQTHMGGEKVFVDFSGDTIDIIDPDAGEVRGAKLFVAGMGASGWSKKIRSAETTTSSIPRSFSYLGCGWRHGIMAACVHWREVGGCGDARIGAEPRSFGEKRTFAAVVAPLIMRFLQEPQASGLFGASYFDICPG